MVSLFKDPYPKASKNSFFWRQQGFPPASCTANNYKPAGGHTIKKLQLSQGSFLQKVAIAFREKPRWFLYLKNPYPKAYKNSFFWRQQGFPPASCTTNNYKPAGGHTIKNLQLSQGSFLQKVAIAFREKPRWFLYLKNPYPKAFENSFFWRQQGFPPARCTANNYKPAGGHTIKNLQLSQGSFLQKVAIAFREKPRWFLYLKNPYPKAYKNSFFWRQQGFPPASCTANNYKPAGRHTIKNLQLSQGSFLQKVAIAFREKPRWFLYLKNPYPKAFENSFFWRQQGFPPARCTANNYKPAGGHTIKNLQLSQGSFLQKVAIAFREKPRWFLYLKNPYPKAFENSFFWRQQGFPPASCTANNYKPAGGHTIKNLQLSKAKQSKATEGNYRQQSTAGTRELQKHANIVNNYKPQPDIQ